MSKSIEGSKSTGDTLAPKLKVAPLEIDPTKVWADDTLDRERVSEALTKLVRPEAGPLVLTLNGGWGTGKTFFLERWRLALEQGGMRAIYFNAWEDDYCGDPLVAIIGQLKKDLDRQYKAKMEAVFNAAKKVGTRAAFKFVSTATAGLLDAQSSDFSSTLGKMLDDYKAEGRSRTQLQKALAALTKDIKKETGGPLIFVIDELDRCRPTFAIELLERVKHLFGIPNMVFILGIDRAQLGSSVRAVYGDIEVDGYLRRFFDMEFVLPPADSGDYCLHLLERHSISLHFQDLRNLAKSDIHSDDLKTCKTALPDVCRWFNLTLRDVEHVIRQLVFAVRNLEVENRFYPELIAILLVVRLRNPSLYLGFVRGGHRASEVLNYIEKQFDRKNLSHSQERKYESILALIYLLSQTDQSDNHIESKQLSLLATEKPLTDPERLSDYTKDMNPQRREEFTKYYFHIKNRDFDSKYPKYYTLKYISGLLDLVSLVSTTPS